MLDAFVPRIDKEIREAAKGKAQEAGASWVSENNNDNDKSNIDIKSLIVKNKVSKALHDYARAHATEAGPSDYKIFREELDTPDVHLSFFDSIKATVPREQALSFWGFEKLLAAPVIVKNKTDAGLFSAAKYVDGKCSRGADNVESVSALFFDFDQCTSLSDIELALESAPGATVVYTTHSHTALTPKFRLVMPLLWPVPAQHYKEVYSLIGSFFTAAGLAYDPAPSNPASLFYKPSHKPGADFITKRNGYDIFDWLTFVSHRCETLQEVPAIVSKKVKGFEAGNLQVKPQAGYVFQRCAVMKEAYETGGAAHQEPLWFGVLRIAAACEPNLARECSDGHHGFTDAGLARKLERIEQEALAPVTCDYLAQHSEQCKQCPWHGLIHSAVALGYEKLPRKSRTLKGVTA